MDVKTYLSKVLILNGGIDLGGSLVSFLNDAGFNINETFVESIEQFEKELLDHCWDLIVCFDDGELSTSIVTALDIHERCRKFHNVPFVVISPEVTSDVRIEWMSQGACDVVDHNNFELLSLVINRESRSRFSVSTSRPSRVSQEEFEESLQGVLDDASSREEKTLVALKIHDWEVVHKSFSSAQSMLFDSTVDKELVKLFSHDKHVIAGHGMAMLLVDSSSMDDISQRIESTFDKLFVDVNDKSFQVAVSAAIIDLNQFAGDKHALLEKARDLVVYAIDKGINKVEIYNPELDLEREATDGNISALVQHALGNKSFELLFQPISSLQGEHDDIYEVLLRIVDPEGKKIAASDFILTVDKSNLAEKIDKWVVLQAVKHLLKKEKEGSSLQLLLHICAASMCEPAFLMWLFVMIEKTGIKPESLVFQISEENVARFGSEATKFIEGLAKIGCRTSICHFGSTANPMGIAQEYATDYIKFNGSMTRELAENPAQEQQLALMVEKLQALGRKTIIPQIENPKVLTRVWRTGSDYIQGYFLQGPEPEMNYNFKSEL